MRCRFKLDKSVNQTISPPSETNPKPSQFSILEFKTLSALLMQFRNSKRMHYRNFFMPTQEALEVASLIASVVLVR